LNIVDSIVTANGGSIRAANREPGGAEFTILLPRAVKVKGAAG
jgi:C4-dicarboxylate-specific signal transduction histidine kinase